jgi:G6PDH family F420-dependent oxidoreductase
MRSDAIRKVVSAAAGLADVGFGKARVPTEGTTMPTSFGYTLSSEEHPPADLVRNAQRAEDEGFDFVSISDHYHPWVSRQGHSPFVWSVLGGIAQATTSIELGVGVTCPIMRIHPAVIAQAAATTSLLAEGRFVLGVGTGEALNEHVVGARWPSPEIRLEMLEEAVHVLRQLWEGDTVDHRGRHYEVENARLFDPPAAEIPVIVSGFGPKAVELAGRIGDGLWAHSPDPEVIETYAKAGGDGPRYAQLNLCWGPDPSAARELAHEVWPNAGLAGQLSQDLPTWTHFEQASSTVSVEQATEHVPCGPDVGPVVESVQQFLDAGFDHLYFHQIGPDQDGFFRFWRDELRPALRDLA